MKVLVYFLASLAGIFCGVYLALYLSTAHPNHQIDTITFQPVRQCDQVTGLDCCDPKTDPKCVEITLDPPAD